MSLKISMGLYIVNDFIIWIISLFFWYVYENLFTLICFMYMLFFQFYWKYVYLFVFLLFKMFGALLLLYFNYKVASMLAA